MGWFSPIKGHYPSLGQVDKTLPVADNATTIQRGMIIKVAEDATNDEGKFTVPETIAEGDLLYIALQDYADAQAGMAGTVGFDANVPSITEGGVTIPGVTAKVPTITGLSIDAEGEYETDQFAPDLLSDPAAKVGLALTVTNGLLSKASGGNRVVGYLTGKVYSRWINNATAKQAGGKVVRQGDSRNVIRFRTK